MLGYSGISRETDIVVDYVRQSMFPFRVDPITITLQKDHSRFDVTFFEVQTKNAGNFRYMFSDHDASYLWDTSLLVEQFGIAAARAFRSYRVEPEDNIQLGEN